MPVRMRPTLLVGFALLLFSVGWTAGGLVTEWRYPLLGWLPLPVIALLAAYASRGVSRLTTLDAGTRRFWRHVAWACGALSLAAVANAYDALHGPVPTQVISLPTFALYLSICLLVIWALLRLPAYQWSRADWARFGLDAGIVLITTGELIWHFALRDLDIWRAHTGSVLPVVGIVLVSSVSLIAFVKVAFAGAGELDRRALRILSAGTALAAASGVLSVFIFDKPYLSTSFLAVPVAGFAALCAAYVQVRHAGESAAPRRVARRVSVVPYLAVAAANGLLLTVSGGESESRIVTACAVAVTALVAIRQIAALRENSKLLKTVDANLQQLQDYQEQLAYQVSHDTLTEIANRSLFEEKVTAQLETGDRFLVALLDLDDFKDVNDRLGHRTGDLLLKTVSRRLHDGLRAEDTVARLGGDEFSLMLPDLGADDAAALMQRVLDRVQQPVLLAGHELTPRISIGVTTSREGDTPEELLRRADVAMYAAKTAGGGRWAWFDALMDRLADLDARMGADLRQAIARDELSVVYQPIVELPAGQLVGVEALVRWNHTEHGPVSPAVFIPLAERSGYIIELGRWVLERVIEQASQWQLVHGPNAPQKISVNISARQLAEPGFAASVAGMLWKARLDPSVLVAEVTETAVLGTGAALSAVRELHHLGLQVALDDFGTGQSSLSLLVSTPVKVLKVDKSFVDGVTSSSPQAVIVDSLIGITDGLRIQAVAEGVETEDQARRLHEVGYRFAQGYHFAHPMPPSEIDRLLTPAPSRFA